MNPPSLTRYAWLSIAAAIATMLLKSGAYLLTGSVGLLSDALESLVNLAGALMALAMLTVAARPPDEDQHALESTGKVLGLVMTVGVVVVRRARCHRDHGQSEHRAGQVDQRLERVRQQAHAAADPPGASLQRDGGQGHRDRQLQVGTDLHRRTSGLRRLGPV